MTRTTDESPAPQQVRDRLRPSDVCIAVATYRRPEGVRTLLDSVLADVGTGATPGPDVLVVDNDAEGSAREIVARYGDRVRYEVEPAPGIVSARNACLRNLRQGTRAVIFVDDDEWVAAGWFERLLDVAAYTKAGVVWGPVVSVFDADAARWLTRGGFIQRESPPDGTDLRTAATNNVLIDLRCFEALSEPWFDDSFSETGGSDAELFWRMRRTGTRIVWASQAVVYEEVPSSRANFPWVWKRLVRSGNVSARLLLRDRSRVVVGLLGAGRVGIGALLVLADLLSGRGMRNRSWSHLAKGIGMVNAVRGRYVREYAR